MMKEGLRISKLECKDVSQGIKLLLETFSSNYLIPSIYRAKGINNFIQLELANPYKNSFYYCLFDRDLLIGIAELKSYGDTAFLNMIAILPAKKGKGYGGLFLEELSQVFKGLGHNEMQLDVFESNDKALKLYQGYGFEVLAKKKLMRVNQWERELSTFKVVNYPQAFVEYEKFGFSLLRILDSENQYHEIGRISNDLIIRSKISANTIGICEKLRVDFGIDEIYYFEEFDFSEGDIPIEKLYRLRKTL